MDYTDFEKAKAGKDAAKRLGLWYQEEAPGDRAQAMLAAANALQEDLAPRSQANLRHARLYGNFEVLGFNLRDYSHAVSNFLPTQRVTLNVAASCVDTLTAKIAKTKPRPEFVTEGGNYKQQKAAKMLDKFCKGVFYEGKFYEEAIKVFLDGCIFDTAAMKIYLDENGRVRFERTFPEELFVDDVDGVYGRPRQLLQKKNIPREVLMQDPDFTDTDEKKAAISTAKCPPGAELHGFGDVIEVWEGWHLASGPKARDGKHVIAIKGCELYCEDWKRDYFPFAFFRYSRRSLGFWGQSLVERLSGIQLEINRLLRSITEQLRRKGKGRIFCQVGSKVNPAHMTNNIADIVYYVGHQPIVDATNAVAPEEFAQLDRLYAKAFQEAGISELSAQAKKPSGLDAAVAIREFNDVESDRFVMVGKAWEQLPVDAADIAIDLVRTCGKPYKVTMPGRRGTQVIEWKDVDLKRDAYVMQCFPVSSLPQTPAYRMQRVEELKAGGYIDQRTAQRLLDFPDIEAENNLAFAAQDDVDETISAILDEETPRYLPPDEFTDMELLVQRASAAYLRAKHFKDIDEKRLGLLIKLIDDTKALITPPPTQTPQGPGPAGMSQGAPMPPPGPMPGGPGGPMQINNNNMQPPAPVAPPVVAQ